MENNQNQGNYLKFFSGGHHLLINVFNVHSIIEIPEITTISQTPKYILGVIVVEGNSVPLLDTPVRLNLTKTKSKIQKTKIIVTIPSDNVEQDEFMPIAFTTEDIDDVIILDQNEIQPLPTEKEEYDDRLFEGTYEHDQKLMMLLNIDNFYKENFDEIIKRKTTK